MNYTTFTTTNTTAAASLVVVVIVNIRVFREKHLCSKRVKYVLTPDRRIRHYKNLSTILFVSKTCTYFEIMYLLRPKVDICLNFRLSSY